MWATAVTAIAGLLLSNVLTIRRERLTRADTYRRELFERKLDAYARLARTAHGALLWESIAPHVPTTEGTDDTPPLGLGKAGEESLDDAVQGARALGQEVVLDLIRVLSDTAIYLPREIEDAAQRVLLAAAHHNLVASRSVEVLVEALKADLGVDDLGTIERP